VQSEKHEIDDRPDGSRWADTRSRGELTIEAKTADGYKVDFISREIAVDGNTPGIDIVKRVLPLFENIDVHGRLDAAGKPVSVDNLDEVTQKTRAAFEPIVKTFEGQDKAVAFMRAIFDSMINVSPAEAARIQLNEVNELSAGQNTGLKPGESLQSTISTASPLGGASITTALTTRIGSYDAKTGAVTYVVSSAMDPDAMKAFASAAMEKLGAAKGQFTAQQAVEVIKAMTVTIDGETTIKVEGGIARSLREDSKTTLKAMGYTLTKTSVETISLRPAP
jgi:hypothetical protein